MNLLDDILSFLADLFWEFASPRRIILLALIALLVFGIVMCYLYC